MIIMYVYLYLKGDPPYETFFAKVKNNVSVKIWNLRNVQ